MLKFCELSDLRLSFTLISLTNSFIKPRCMYVCMYVNPGQKQSPLSFVGEERKLVPRVS